MRQSSWLPKPETHSEADELICRRSILVEELQYG
jgi:hypothetical protein